MNKNKFIIEYLTDFLDYLEIEKGLSNKTQEFPLGKNALESTRHIGQ